MAVDRNSRPVLTGCAGSRCRACIDGVRPFRPESSSFPIFQRATMPQVPSPDTGEGLGSGRFGLYLPTQWASIGAAIRPPPMRRSSQRRTRLPRGPCRCGWQGKGRGSGVTGIADRPLADEPTRYVTPRLSGSFRRAPSWLQLLNFRRRPPPRQRDSCRHRP